MFLVQHISQIHSQNLCNYHVSRLSWLEKLHRLPKNLVTLLASSSILFKCILKLFCERTKHWNSEQNFLTWPLYYLATYTNTIYHHTQNKIRSYLIMLPYKFCVVCSWTTLEFFSPFTYHVHLYMLKTAKSLSTQIPFSSLSIYNLHTTIHLLIFSSFSISIYLYTYM